MAMPSTTSVHKFSSNNWLELQSLILNKVYDCKEFDMDVVLTVTKRPSSLLPPLTADMVINGTSMNSAINQMTAYINTVKFANPVFGGPDKATLHSDVINLYQNIYGTMHVIACLRFLMIATEPDLTGYKLYIQNDLDNLLVIPACFESAMKQTNPVPPVVPTVLAPSNANKPIWPRLRLSFYGYKAGLSEEIANRILDQACSDAGAPAVAAKLRFLVDVWTKKNCCPKTGHLSFFKRDLKYVNDMWLYTGDESLDEEVEDVVLPEYV
jgi:hypothetical protein